MITKTINNTEILHPKNQLNLFGYDKYFKIFSKLFQNNRLPNTILLSGPKGLGKATFAYHFINFILSYRDSNKYSVDNYSIDANNTTYKNICDNTHPNFFSPDNNSVDENIKIENTRNIIKFLNKSTYNLEKKIIIIDNVENLNVSSSNSLLKVLEEPNPNTFFFIINNNSYKIPNTIKSRSIEFKFFFSSNEKEIILKKLINQYFKDFDSSIIDNNILLESPGNIIKFLKLFYESNLVSLKEKLPFIYYLISIYKKTKSPYIFNLISLMIEFFYKDLSFKNNKKLLIYSHNKFQVLEHLNNAKNFNLDKNNLFLTIQGILDNES